LKKIIKEKNITVGYLHDGEERMKIQVFLNKEEFASRASEEINKIDPSYPYLDVILRILGDLSPGISITLNNKKRKDWIGLIYLDPSEKAYYSRYIHELIHIAIFRFFYFLPGKIKTIIQDLFDLFSWTYKII